MATKITLNPSYATANTVRFDEAVEDTGDFLNPSQPVLGNMYLERHTLAAIGWEGKVGPEYAAEGRNGKVYTRRDVAGKGITVTITVA